MRLQIDTPIQVGPALGPLGKHADHRPVSVSTRVAGGRRDCLLFHPVEDIDHLDVREGVQTLKRILGELGGIRSIVAVIASQSSSIGSVRGD